MESGFYRVSVLTAIPVAIIVAFLCVQASPLGRWEYWWATLPLWAVLSFICAALATRLAILKEGGEL